VTRPSTLTLILALTWTSTWTWTARADEPPAPPPEQAEPVAPAEEAAEAPPPPAAQPEAPPPPQSRASPAPDVPTRVAVDTVPTAETVVRTRPPATAAPRADQTAAASVVLSGDSPHGYDDLASLLAAIPGVNVVRTGSLGKTSTITLRGSNPDQVRVYIDGVPLNIASGGGVDVSTLPIGDVERVEVYRGSSPLEFGESALGGIISITTRTPGVARATARTGAGSFGTMFGDVSGGGRAGRLRLYMGVHALSAQGDFPYLNDKGTAFNTSDDVMMPRQNNDVQQVDGVMRAGLTMVGRRTLDLGLLAFARDEGLPGPGRFPTVSARFRTMRGLGYLRYESREDLGAGGRLAAQLYASLQRDRLDDAANETGLGGAAMTHNTTQTAGMNTYAARPFGDWVRGALVLEGRHETYQPVDEAAAVPAGVPARRLAGVAGGEIDLRWRWADLDVIPSARVEAMQDAISRRDAAGIPVEGTPAVFRRSPVLRIGVVRPLVDRQTLKIVAKANAGRYVRVPSFIELYGNGTALVLGNDDLVPEHGTNTDLGIWIDRAGERLGLMSRTTAFASWVDDLIQWQYASWGQARADNLARARILGVEQELRLMFGRWGRLVGQGTFMDARDRSANAAANGKLLAFHPRYRGYLRPELVRVDLPAGLALGAYADAELRMRDYADPANLVDLRTRLLVGCGVSLAFPRGRLRMTASAANLTGTQREDVDNWSLPGRTVFLTLAYAPFGAADDAGAAIFDPRYGP
jgi:iron complex outermembrane receptor protein